MRNQKTRRLLTLLSVAFLAVFSVILILKNYHHSALKETQKYSVAMGTVITQKLYDEEDALSVCGEIENVINSLENEISWRKEASPIYSINKNSKAACDEELCEVIRKCTDIYSSSGGAFDITVGKLTTMWNIGEENATVPEKKAIKNALSFVDGSLIELNDGVASLAEGQFIDLGAVGKGLACDKVREYLLTTEIDGAVVSVGGSVLLYGENPDDKKWSVAVRDPMGESSDYMGILELSQCCVSTSGDYERVLEKDGKTYHHILDPKTGYPSDSGLKSVTVVCESGLISDALSTACFVLGREKGEALLKKYGAEGIFIDGESNVYVTSGLSEAFTISSQSYTLVEE